jgi:hypothetical protein
MRSSESRAVDGYSADNAVHFIRPHSGLGFCPAGHTYNTVIFLENALFGLAVQATGEYNSGL